MKSQISKSFTLIELLVAVFIFAMTTVIVFAAFSSSISYQAKTRVIRETTQSARFFMEAVAREVRLADEIRFEDYINYQLPDGWFTSGALTLVIVKDGAVKKYKYDRLNKKIILEDGSEVITGNVEVSDLIFFSGRPFTLQGTGVKIQITVKEKKFLRMAEKGVITLQTTVYTRGYEQ